MLYDILAVVLLLAHHHGPLDLARGGEWLLGGALLLDEGVDGQVIVWTVQPTELLLVREEGKRLAIEPRRPRLQ